MGQAQACTPRETQWYLLLVIVVRCTAKLLERLPARSDPPVTLSTSRLGDWCATLIPERLVEVAVMLESYGVPADV